MSTTGKVEARVCHVTCTRGEAFLFSGAEIRKDSFCDVMLVSFTACNVPEPNPRNPYGKVLGLLDLPATNKKMKEHIIIKI